MDETIHQQVSDRYARAAATGEQMCCPTGYDFSDLRRFVPEEVLKISYGCGTPAGLQTVNVGETVLDIGSGGGIDCFEASRRVGPSGRVIGLDMTDTMLAIARRNAPVVAANLGYPTTNVEFRKGMAETMPVEDASIDLIISNCVINLSPDKRRVFGEMFRVLRPGGRFTISDIVSDQIVPQYLVHDQAKWGDCLSGALPLWDYLDGLGAAGFLGLHQVKCVPWQAIDGVHFLSITLTGYKLPDPSHAGGSRHATLRGPFSRVKDELGRTFERGVPQPIDPRTAQLLALPPLAPLFVLAERPTALLQEDPRYCAVLPEQVPCVWQGHYAMLAGPFVEAADDDRHLFRRGVPLEICSKTCKVVTSEPYAPHLAIMNRASSPVSGSEACCGPSSSGSGPTGGCC